MEKKKATSCKTGVFWDIDSCPVPLGYDATLVAPSIHLALEKLGYRRPHTITAVGKLKRTPQHVLRAISSTGIIVKYGPCGKFSTLSQLQRWECSIRAPATIMLISGSSVLECLSSSLHALQMEGCTILLAYPSAIPEEEKLYPELVGSAELLWNSLLTDSDNNKLEAKRQLLLQECSETGESDSFSCVLCDGSAWQSAEEFTTHLRGLDHQVRSFGCGVDTDYLDSVTLHMLKKKLKRLDMRKFKNEGAKSSRRKEVTTLIAKKKKWEKLKNKLKKRDELASQEQD